MTLCWRSSGSPPLATRARLPRGGDHGLDGQDVHQGHLGRAAGAVRGHPREPRELQHGDRRAADDPRGRQGHRGACARDGDEGSRANRRARPDRRARRGRDRQRRPGAPGAARNGRAGGRREGRADPRPARRRGLRGAGVRAAARRPPARRPRHVDLRPGGPGAAAVDGWQPRRDRGARDHDPARPAVLGAAQPAQHSRRGGCRPRARLAGRGPRGCAVLLAARRGG